MKIASRCFLILTSVAVVLLLFFFLDLHNSSSSIITGHALINRIRSGNREWTKINNKVEEILGADNSTVKSTPGGNYNQSESKIRRNNNFTS